MVTLNKTTALALLLGAFIFFFILFFLIVGCTLCVMRLRKKEEDQERLLNSGMSPRDFDDEATNVIVSRRGGHKPRNHANDEVFEMEVFHYNESNKEPPSQGVKI